MQIYIFSKNVISDKSSVLSEKLFGDIAEAEATADNSCGERATILLVKPVQIFRSVVHIELEWDMCK